MTLFTGSQRVADKLAVDLKGKAGSRSITDGLLTAGATGVPLNIPTCENRCFSATATCENQEVFRRLFGRVPIFALPDIWLFEATAIKDCHKLDGSWLDPG